MDLIQKLLQREIHVRKAQLGTPNFNSFTDPTGEIERACIKSDPEFRRRKTDTLFNSEIEICEAMAKNASNRHLKERTSDAAIEEKGMAASWKRNGLKTQVYGGQSSEADPTRHYLMLLPQRILQNVHFAGN
jgi:hypothetical protein